VNPDICDNRGAAGRACGNSLSTRRPRAPPARAARARRPRAPPARAARARRPRAPPARGARSGTAVIVEIRL